MQIDIIHVISSLQVGGAERFVIDLACQQVLDGHKVLVLNLGDYNDPLLKDASENKLKVTTIPTKRILWPKNRIVQQLCTAKTVHVHNAVAIFRICVYIPFLKGSLIYTRHSERVLSTVTKLAHVLAKHKVKAITFVSEGSKKSFYEQFNWGNIKSLIIDNGIFIPPQELITNRTNKIVKIVSIGRMIALKRHVDLLEAVALMEPHLREKIEIHFYGDGELRDKIENKAKQLNVNTIFHGMVIDRESIYSDSDITVCMSETEGLSIALLESMAWAIPIIATNVGGNPYCVIDKKNGYLYECGDVKALQEKLNLLIDNSATRIEMGTFGRQRAIELFSISRSAEAYYDCYWN